MVKRPPRPAGAADRELEPYYATPRSPERPRLLLVSYHFPPSPTVGGLRWQKLARVAHTRGWSLDIIAADPGGLATSDRQRLDDLPPGTAVYGVAEGKSPFDAAVDRLWSRWHSGRRPGAPRARAKSFSRGEVAALRNWRALARHYHAWVVYRDERRWASDAARAADVLMSKNRYRAVISCGPPHFLHPAICRAAARRGVPFIVDMRDPWRLMERLPAAMASPLWLWLAARQERRVVRRARLIVMNTAPARDAMRACYPAAADRIIAVPNGFDADADRVPGPPPSVPTVGDRPRFVIAYAGTIYLDRDPGPLFRAVAGVVKRFGLEPAEIGIEFMGEAQSYNGTTVESLARDAGIDGFLRVRPRGSRSAALEFLSSAAMLVVLPQDSAMAIPAKLFEYMQFDAAVLALADPQSATAQLLAGTDADVVPPGDVDAMERVIAHRVREFTAGHRPRRLASHRNLSREAQAGPLFDFLEALPGTPPGSGASTVDHGRAGGTHPESAAPLRLARRHK